MTLTPLQFIHSKKATESWLKDMKINDYFILEQKMGEFSVNVGKSVDLSQKELTAIPIQFGLVNGSFNCSCNRLQSLKGVARFVNGAFDCSYNYLDTLDGSPLEVDSKFLAQYNQIHDISHLPKMIHDILNLKNNLITELDLASITISNSILLFDNPIDTIHSLPQLNLDKKDKIEMWLNEKSPFLKEYLKHNPSASHVNTHYLDCEKLLVYVEKLKLEKALNEKTLLKTNTLKI